MVINTIGRVKEDVSCTEEHLGDLMAKPDSFNGVTFIDASI